MNNNMYTTLTLPTNNFSIKALKTLYQAYKNAEESNDGFGDEKPQKNQKAKEQMKLPDDVMQYLKTKKETSKKELKAKKDAVISYIESYYFEVEKGNYYFYDVETNEFLFKKKEDFKNEVLVKIYCDQKISGNILRNDKRYRISARLDRPRLYEEKEQYYLNECKRFLHTNYKPYNEYSDDIKHKVQMMLDMIKEISCNNNDEMYQAYIKYLSQLCWGKKSEVAIYKKSWEGTGKSCVGK